MAASFYLDTKKRSSKTGECPIKVAVHLYGVRALTTIGYSISQNSWNQDAECVIKGRENHKGISYNSINSRINAIKSAFQKYEAREAKLSHQEILDVIAECVGRAPKENVESSFFSFFESFIKDGIENGHWAYNTTKKWTGFKKHLEKFNPYLTFESFDRDTLDAYVRFCSIELQMLDVSVSKDLSLLRWYMNWAADRGYHNNMTFKGYRAKLKDTKKPVIFLTNDELLKLYNFKIPKNGTVVTLYSLNGNEYQKEVSNKASLDKVRDLFCFCAFTSLRYSDMATLKRTDIYDDAIHITTHKTDDPLVIELNTRAKAILEKYKGFDFDGLALPVISNQKMNQFLKEICELCGFNTPITITTYKNGERGDFTFSKWQVIGTHAARRTFICHALASGIPPQVIMKWTGHSDYKSMLPYIGVAQDTTKKAMDTFDKSF